MHACSSNDETGSLREISPKSEGGRGRGGGVSYLRESIPEGEQGAICPGHLAGPPGPFDS